MQVYVRMDRFYFTKYLHRIGFLYIFVRVGIKMLCIGIKTIILYVRVFYWDWRKNHHKTCLDIAYTAKNSVMVHRLKNKFWQKVEKRYRRPWQKQKSA